MYRHLNKFWLVYLMFPVRTCYVPNTLVVFRSFNGDCSTFEQRIDVQRWRSVSSSRSHQPSRLLTRLLYGVGRFPHDGSNDGVNEHVNCVLQSCFNYWLRVLQFLVFASVSQGVLLWYFNVANLRCAVGFELRFHSPGYWVSMRAIRRSLFVTDIVCTSTAVVPVELWSRFIGCRLGKSGNHWGNSQIKFVVHSYLTLFAVLLQHGISMNIPSNVVLVSWVWTVAHDHVYSWTLVMRLWATWLVSKNTSTFLIGPLVMMLFSSWHVQWLFVIVLFSAWHSQVFLRNQSSCGPV